MSFFKSVVLLSLVVANLCGGEDGGGSCQYEVVEMGVLKDSTLNESLLFCTLSKCNCLDDYRSSQCLCYDSAVNYSKTIEDSDFIVYMISGIHFVIALLAVPVIIFFNVNLVSGPKQSLVFFYQCLPLVTTFTGKLLAYLVLQNQIYDNKLFRRDPMFMRFYIFQYLKYVIVIIEILLVLFLVKCSWCPLQKCRLPWAKTRRAVRNFREKHVPKHCVIHGICSVVLLAYGDLLAISSLIALNMFQTCCYDTENGCPQLCVKVGKLREAVFGDNVEHKLNVFKAFPTIVLVLLLPLPLSLIYYPTIPALFHKLTKRSLPRFPKLDPVFDVFQGVYKDKMRWFAGVHLLYRMILWVVFIGLAFNPNLQNFIILTSLMVILAIHSLFQPYTAHNHNYIETLFLVCLLLTAAFHQLVLYFLFLYPDKLDMANICRGLTAVLGVLPIIVIAGLNLYKCCRNRLPSHPRLASCCKFSKKSHRESRQSDMSDPHIYNHVWVAETLRRQEDAK